MGGLTILRPKALRIIDAYAVGTKRQEIQLEVVRVISQIDPRFSSCIIGEDVIHVRDRRWSIDVRDVAAEVPEIVGAVGGVPIELLPGIRWVVHWSSNCIGLLLKDQ